MEQQNQQLYKKKRENRRLTKVIAVFLAIIASIMLIWLVGFGYDRRIKKQEYISYAYKGPYNDQVIFIRDYRVSRSPTGVINNFLGDMASTYLFNTRILYTLNLTTNRLAKVAELGERTFDTTKHARISWSPHFIAYSTPFLLDNNYRNIKGFFLLKSDGSGRRLLVEEGYHPDISPDEQWIVYQKERNDSKEAWMVQPDGSNDHLVTALPKDVSPDFVEWNGNNQILLHVRNSAVYEFDLRTKQIQKSTLPYKYNLGGITEWEVQKPYTGEVTHEDYDKYGLSTNIAALKGYLENRTSEEWGVPNFPPKALLPILFPWESTLEY